MTVGPINAGKPKQYIPGSVVDTGQADANTPVQPSDNSEELNAAVNNSLYALLNDNKNFSPNALNTLQQVAYHWRFFMTTEHELITTAGTADINAMFNTLDSIPKAIIAESGVTVGFNIGDVEFENNCGPGWRNRNTIMGNMMINITEPLGASMLEAILLSAKALGVSNYNKMWYYMELTFRGYNEDGSINLNPLAALNLKNGGRWIFQIALTNVEMHMSEAGATYQLTAVPYGMTAFEDASWGRTPDTLQASGGTIQAFLDDFAKNLTDVWSARYEGELVTFKFQIKPVSDSPKNPGSFVLEQTELDPDRTLKMDVGANKMPICHVPVGTSVYDMVMFLYSYCKDARIMMLDNTDPAGTCDTNTEGATATFNQKVYRVPILPMIEADTRVTGYDPVTDQYMKAITYTIWSYRSYTSNLCIAQSTRIKNDPTIPVKITQDLLKRNYLSKRYYYQYTGENTEILKFNIEYNFAYASLLPKLDGWRNDYNSVSQQAKYNPAIGSKLPNNVIVDPNLKSNTTAPIQSTTTQTQQPDLTQLQSQQADLTSKIDAARAKLTSDQQDEVNRANTVLIGQDTNALNALLAQRVALTPKVQQARTDYGVAQAALKAKIEASGIQHFQAEDAIQGNDILQTLTYLQAHSSIPDNGGHVGQWDRGASLVGALMNQQYAPDSSGLIQIELEIRGDPYWIGASYLESRIDQANTDPTPPPKNATDALYPNYKEGDATFALIFRFPIGVDQNGAPVIRSNTIKNADGTITKSGDIYNGLYRAVRVKNQFTGGVFKQTLFANKLELVSNLKLTGGTADVTPQTGTTTDSP